MLSTRRSIPYYSELTKVELLATHRKAHVRVAKIRQPYFSVIQKEEGGGGGG